MSNEVVYNYILRENSVSFKNDFYLRYTTLIGLVESSLRQSGVMKDVWPEISTVSSAQHLSSRLQKRQASTQAGFVIFFSIAWWIARRSCPLWRGVSRDSTNATACLEMHT